MKQTLFALLFALTLTFVTGCGSGSTEIVAGDVSAEDVQAEQERAEEYDSDQYAKAMREQNRKK